MKRRIISLALVIVMMIGFAIPVYADFYEFNSVFAYYDQNNAEKNINDSLYGSYSGDNWSWDGSDTTLTLNGTTETQRFDLYNPSHPVTLVVNGDNALYYLDNYDVYDNQEDMTISGSGSLTINSMFGGDVYCKGPDITFTSQASGTYYAEKGTLTFQDYAEPHWGETNPIGGGVYIIDIRNREIDDFFVNYLFEHAALTFEIGAEYGTMPDYFKDLSFEDENGDPVSFAVMTQTGTYSDGDYYVSVKQDGSYAKYVKITNPNYVATEPDPTPDPEPEPDPTCFEVNFKYTDAMGSGVDVSAWYDDTYFANSSYEFNWDLAWLTLGLELSAWTAETDTWGEGVAGGESRYANIADAYEQMGFQDAKYYDYGISLNDTANTAAYSIATKELSNGSTLMAVVVRGGNYGAHWAGNFNVGNGSANHSGFNKPAEMIYNKVISELGNVSGNVKLWITGYSRGAAIANILAAKLDDYTKKTSKFAAEDIFTYTFATPQGVVASKNTGLDLYKNIFNIVNPGDIVPQVAPDAWGYGRYGETLYFDSYTGQIDLDQVNSACREYGSLNYKAEDNLKNRVTEQALLDILTKNFPTAASSENFQPAIQGLLEYANTKKAVGSQWKNITIAEYDQSLTELHGDRYTQAYARATKTLTETPQGAALMFLLPKEDDTTGIITTFLAICEENGLNSVGVVNLLYKVLSQNLTAVKQMIYDPESVSAFGAEHMSATYLAWMSQSTDYDSFIDSTEAKNMGLRVAQIACPVDIFVYDENDNLVAEIRDHNLIDAEFPVVTLGESTTLYMPRGSADYYRVEIIPTESGTMSYTVTEYDMDQQLVSRANYLDIPINPNQVYTGDLVDMDPTNEDRFDLVLEENGSIRGISADQYLTGDCTVTLTATTEGNGTVSGAGSYIAGDTAHLTAIPESGYEFAGWYLSNKLLSKEEQVNLRVDKDTTVQAKFTASGTCPRDESCALKKFTDTSATWAHDGIEFAVNNGLMNGTGDGSTFSPKGTMTRAMLVTVLYRNEGSPKAGTSNFTDLTQGWYKDAVAWAAENGIVNGTGDGEFNPNGAVTREQIAAIMYRYAEYKGVDVSQLGDISGFPDAETVHSWAKKEIQWAVGAGLITGKGSAEGVTLAPIDTADRASVATILMRFIQNVVEK